MSGGVSEDPPGEERFTVALDAETLRRRSAGGSAVTAVAQVAKLGLQIGSQVVLARLLFPADFGLLALAYPVIALVAVLSDLGLGQAIVQRPSLVQAQVSALFWVNMGVSFVLAVAVLLATPLAVAAYREPKLFAPMAVLALTIPLGALATHPFALLSRRMRFGAIASIEVAATLAGVATAVVCALRGWSYWSLVAGQFANTAVSVALGWSACGWAPSWPRWNARTWADLRFGGALTGANLATFVTTSADNVIVGVFAGRVPLGLYDRSYRLAVQPVGQMLAPVGRVAVPLLSRLVDTPDEYRSAYLTIFRAQLLITVPALLVCATQASLLIHVVMGDRWAGAAPIFAWICAGGLAAGVYSSLFWLFISQGRTREMMTFTILAAGINLASFLLGALWGVVGVAALAALGFVFVTTPLVVYGATRAGAVRPRDLAGPGLAATLATAALGVALSGVAPSLRPMGFLGLMIASLAAYGGLPALMMLSPTERPALRRLATRLLPMRARLRR